MFQWIDTFKKALDSAPSKVIARCRSILAAFVMLLLSACASIQQSTVVSDESPEEQIVVTGSRIKRHEPQATTQISPELLKEDLAFIRHKLLEIHPQPFARVDETEFDLAYQSLTQQLNAPMTRGQFFTLVMPLLASLRDVHTYLDLPIDNKGNYRNLDERLFPLAVILEHGKLFVAADLSSLPKVATGAQLLSINGISVSTLINKMRTITPKETESGQDRRIQMDFARLLATIGEAKSQFKVEYIFSHQRQVVELEGIKRPDNQGNTESTISYYGFSKLTAKTALLWLNDFNESPEKFEEYLNAKFAEMTQNGIENLIIDLRYNSGGLSENLKALLSKITDKPIFWAKSGQIKVSEHLQRHHRKKTRHRRQNKLSWGLKWLPVEWTNEIQRSIWWAEPGETINLQLEPVEPDKNKSIKRMWVLTNGFCYSACSFFVAAVNHYQLAETVGEPPGSLADFQFAYPMMLELPHSHLRLNLPSMRLDFVTHGGLPLISPSFDLARGQIDIELKRDVVLNHALQEAESSQLAKSQLQ